MIPDLVSLISGYQKAVKSSVRPSVRPITPKKPLSQDACAPAFEALPVKRPQVKDYARLVGESDQPKKARQTSTVEVKDFARLVGEPDQPKKTKQRKKYPLFHLLFI